MEISNADRIIVLVDMDCFYVQVEQKLCPEYQSKPCAVVQYNTWKGGSILAVSYEARAKGVTRFLRGADAQKVCPDIHLFRVPEIRGKADLTKYRDAGASVLDVLCEYSDCVERASIDEAYLDMTSIINSKIESAPQVTADQLKNTFVVGWEGSNLESKKEEIEKWLQMIYEEEHLYKDRMLALAAVIVEEMRTAVYEKTGYRCSAGIAHNKMLAKLSCGIHKPNKQTVLPQSSIQILFKTMPIKKVRNLGGKLGEAIVKKFNVENMGDLIDVPESQFVSQFGSKTGHWLYCLVRGMDDEPVISRQLPKSIGCGKNFPGKKSLSTRNDVIHWLKQLSIELEERLVKDQNVNKRFARLLTVSLRTQENNEFSAVSRSCPIHVYNAEKLAQDALVSISKLNTSSSDTVWKPSIWTLSMAASKFENKVDNQCDIQSYFSRIASSSKEEINRKNASSEFTSSVFEENKECTLSKPTSPHIGEIDYQDCLSTDSTLSCTEGNKLVEHMHNTETKSLKNSDNSNKSIISFFTKKQLAKTELTDHAETVNTRKYESNKREQFDSSISIDTSSCSSDMMAENEFCDSEISSVVENSESASSEQKGFFAKKLEEKMKLSSSTKHNPDASNELTGKENINLPEDSSSILTSVPSCSTSENVTELSHVNDDNEYSNLDPELTKLCDECNKFIPIWEESEHLDYHIALNLSKECSVKPSSNSSSIESKPSLISAKTDNTSNSVSKQKNSRKRGSASKSSSKSKKPFMQTNTLDLFLKKSNIL